MTIATCKCDAVTLSIIERGTDLIWVKNGCPVHTGILKSSLSGKKLIQKFTIIRGPKDSARFMAKKHVLLKKPKKLEDLL